MSNEGYTGAPELIKIDWAGLKTRWRTMTKRAKIGLIVLVVAVANAWGIILPIHSSAADANMMLFWDPANGSPPSDWCVVSSFDDRFIRGDTPANYGTTGGGPTDLSDRPFQFTTSTSSHGNNATGPGSDGSGTNIAARVHTHTINLSYTAENNGSPSYPGVPAFRSLQIILYKGGNGSCTGDGAPNTIPANAIALFSSLPASGWTQVTAQNGKFLRADSTVTTGGGDTAYTDVGVTGYSATATATVHENAFLINGSASPQSHTHSPPGALNCSAGCGAGNPACPIQGAAGSGAAGVSTFRCTATGVLPRYTQPIMASANASTSTLSVNLTAMFDGDPGTGWSVLSNSTGTNPYYQKFIRPNSTADLTTSFGADNHSITFGGTTGGSIGGAVTTFATGDTSAASSHAHVMTATTSSLSNIPPYVNVVVAQKVSFTLNQYQWYVAPTSLQTPADNVTDRWPTGSLDTNVNTQIVAVPAPYDPPEDGDQLRLRVQITVSGQPLAINTLSFKLQYAQGTAASNCTSGAWTDVAASGTTSNPWRYGTDSNITDGVQLQSNELSSTRLENFYKSASTGAGFTNPAAAATGETIEYDWIIQDYQAPGASQYNFRVVENHSPDPDVLLSVYSTCPSLITRPTTDQLLRHGEFFQEGSNAGFLWAD